MKVPKFAWNDGSPHTFTPSYPATSKTPIATRSALRHDDFTGDGTGQWITDRVDKFLTLPFNFVPPDDVADWEAFIDYAIEGKVFTYYPDSTDSGTHTDYTLEDQDWKPQFLFATPEGNWLKFTLTLREYVS